MGDRHPQPVPIWGPDHEMALGRLCEHLPPGQREHAMNRLRALVFAGWRTGWTDDETASPTQP